MLRVLRRFQDGSYRVVIDSVEDGISQAGNPKLNIKTRILEGNYKNRNLFYTLL